MSRAWFYNHSLYVIILSLAMENLSPTARKICMVDDHNIKFKSLFFDMDLAMHRSSNSPRGRRQQKSLDSHEDFEFTMSHNMSMQEDSIDLQAMEVACADKLFFKGQIVPLQPNPKIHSLQPMACPKLEEGYCQNGNSLSRHLREYLSLQSLNQRRTVAATSESSLGMHDSEKGCFTKCHNEEISTYPQQYRPSQGGLFRAPLRCVNEEGPLAEFSLHDGTDLMRSYRLDSAFDLFQNDSRSSSFRSHHSNNYWSSAEKDSRDSSSSSRCSNGSSQESACFQGVEKKALHNISSMQLKASHPGSIANSTFDQSELCGIMGEFSLSTNSNHGDHGKPPAAHVSRLSSRRWSWKGLFTGLRKASKLWVDDGRADGESKHNNAGGSKKPIFTFKELPGGIGESTSGYRRSVGHDWEWHPNTYQFVSREGSIKKGNQPAKGWGSTFGVRDDCEGHIGTIYCLRSGGRQEAALSSIDAGSVGEVASKREKGKVQGNNVWNAKESWNKCINNMKKSTRLSVSACKLVTNKELESNMNKGASRLINEEDKIDIYRVMKAKSLSSTPLAKSPVRRAEYGNMNAMNVVSLNGSYHVGLYSYLQGGVPGLAAPTNLTSMKRSNKKMGFAASCPASMRSSPHHSGLLAVVNKATPDLHTAIQGAIAHCKQSQSAAADPRP